MTKNNAVLFKKLIPNKLRKRLFLWCKSLQIFFVVGNPLSMLLLTHYGSIIGTFIIDVTQIDRNLLATKEHKVKDMIVDRVKWTSLFYLYSTF